MQVSAQSGQTLAMVQTRSARADDKLRQASGPFYAIVGVW